MLIVRTTNGIETNTQDDFLNFDASNKALVKKFVAWHNAKGYTPTLINKDGIVVKGKPTEKAIAKYGAEFDTVIAGLSQSIVNAFNPMQSTPTTSEIANINAQLNDPNVSAAKKEELKNKLTALYQKGKDSGLFDIVGGFLKDKLGMGQNTGGSYGGDYSGSVDYLEKEKEKEKGLSTGAIIGIVVGAAAVIGLIVYAAKKK